MEAKKTLEQFLFFIAELPSSIKKNIVEGTVHRFFDLQATGISLKKP